MSKVHRTQWNTYISSDTAVRHMVFLCFLGGISFTFFGLEVSIQTVFFFLNPRAASAFRSSWYLLWEFWAVTMPQGPSVNLRNIKVVVWGRASQSFVFWASLRGAEKIHYLFYPTTSQTNTHGPSILHTSIFKTQFNSSMKTAVLKSQT